MWEELYERYYPELLRYAAAACRNAEEGEDLTQEVFLRALQNVGILEDLGPNQRRAWLYRTLKNTIRDRWRHTQVENAYLEREMPEVAAPDAGMEAVENALLLGSLKPEDRTLFTLRYLEGYNAQEISQMLGIPSGTIRARLSRCRVLLKQQLDSF